jgi:hypothetical protein
VVALVHPGGYGDGSTVAVEGSSHALALLFNGDNAGLGRVLVIPRKTALCVELVSSQLVARCLSEVWEVDDGTNWVAVPEARVRAIETPSSCHH